MYDVELIVLGIPVSNFTTAARHSRHTDRLFLPDRDGKSGRDGPILERGLSATVRHGKSNAGWCKDRWGLSWQITPRALTDALAAGGGEAPGNFGR